MPAFKTTALPSPDATFTVREVARHAECTIRTVRNYIRVKVVPAPKFRSSKTRYDRAFLVRLRAAMVLRRRGLHVRGVLETLAATSPEELFHLAGYDTPPEGIEAVVATLAAPGDRSGAHEPGEVGRTGPRGASGAPGHGAQRSLPGAGDGAGAAAGSSGGGGAWPGAEHARDGVGTPRALPAGFLGRYRPGAVAPHERWDAFEICPGVKLVVRAEPDPEALRVAEEILALFGPPG